MQSDRRQRMQKASMGGRDHAGIGMATSIGRSAMHSKQADACSL